MYCNIYLAFHRKATADTHKMLDQQKPWMKSRLIKFPRMLVASCIDCFRNSCTLCCFLLSYMQAIRIYQIQQLADICIAFVVFCFGKIQLFYSIDLQYSTNFATSYLGYTISNDSMQLIPYSLRFPRPHYSSHLPTYSATNKNKIEITFTHRTHSSD